MTSLVCTAPPEIIHHISSWLGMRFCSRGAMATTWSKLIVMVAKQRMLADLKRHPWFRATSAVLDRRSPQAEDFRYIGLWHDWAMTMSADLRGKKHWSLCELVESKTHMQFGTRTNHVVHIVAFVHGSGNTFSLIVNDRLLLSTNTAPLNSAVPRLAL